MTQRSINAYMDIVNIEEEELKELMNVDTWIDGEEALKMGFATKLLKTDEKQVATQSVRQSLMQKVKNEDGDIVSDNYNINKEGLKKLIQNEIKNLSTQKEEKDEISDEELEQPKQTNKPLDMMRAVFNFKEEK